MTDPEAEARSHIEAVIGRATGEEASLTSFTKLSGGCINDSRLINLSDGRKYFLKTNPGHERYPGLFEGEFRALELLAEPEIIDVPRPVAVDKGFLVLEAFQEGSPSPDWQEQMGRRMALLHRACPQEHFGFYQDNYLGTTPQPNDWMSDWKDFWREKRLGWQLELFARKAPAGDRLLKLGRALMDRLDTLLDVANEPPVLLHGDLWSGNATANGKGEPVIFDPASYYGQREAEIGMMRLFGGFGSRCEAAYQEVWPLADGAEERIAIYRLYHELNHLNLFGGGYYETCLRSLTTLLP